MLQGILWIIGSLVIANLALTTLGFAVFAFLLHPLGSFDPSTEPKADDVDLSPLTVLPGVAQEVPEEFWPILERAHQGLRRKLSLVGILLGFLAVLGAYVILAVSAPHSSVAHWCLLAFPFNGYAKIGARGLRIDFRLVGHVAAVFKQLFYSSFTSSSFLTAAVILLLRWFEVFP